MLAVVICNYNKRELLCKCIEAVLHSDFKEFDLIVVDNASKDDSVPTVKSRYTNVKLIENKENLGGSGGFNAGLSYALNGDYKYIVLLDNDAYLKEDALSAFVRFMDGKNGVALAGAKIYSANAPNIIQDFGSFIDFENYSINVDYKNFTDDGSLPAVTYCDYVPACAAIVRKTALERVGLLNEQNFLYWDDIEWGHRFKLGGYKVCAISNAVVWHEQGAAQRVTTAPSYYFWRNRIRFFAKYLPEDRIEDFCERLLKEFFRAVSACIINERFNMAQTLQNALYDALYGIAGKAEALLPADPLLDIDTITKDKQIKYVVHIFDETEYPEDLIYVDEYKNIVFTSEGRRFCKNFNSAYEHFRAANFGFAYQKLLELKERLKA